VVDYSIYADRCYPPECRLEGLSPNNKQSRCDSVWALQGPALVPSTGERGRVKVEIPCVSTGAALLNWRHRGSRGDVHPSQPRTPTGSFRGSSTRHLGERLFVDCGILSMAVSPGEDDGDGGAGECEPEERGPFDGSEDGGG
jgi:hypothetical protein